jgi:UPF0755 protein
VSGPDDVDVWADHEALHEEVSATGPDPDAADLAEHDALIAAYQAHTQRRHGPVFWSVLVVLMVAVVGVAGGVLWFNAQFNPGDPGDETQVSLPAGASAPVVAEALAREGVITSATAFGWYTRWRPLGPVRGGTYALRKRQPMADVVATIRRGPPVNEVRVTIPEGFTVAQVAARVAKEMPWITAEEFVAASENGAVRSPVLPDGIDSLEGLLYPETYAFGEGVAAQAVQQRMVSQFDSVIERLGQPSVAGVTPYEAVIIASMIEKEAKIEDDRAKVARVIYNRLAKGQRLQVDPTVYYKQPKGTSFATAVENDTPYNTYRRTGLPPTPICNPGQASLQAAWNPVDGPWFFYVTVNRNTGEMAYNVSFEEHKKAIAAAKAAGTY